jgi:hypothetical protein
MEKNIFLLSTDKPSRLFDCFGKLGIGDNTTTREGLQVTNQHIYITNSEEIKERDWVIWFGKDKQPFLKKVIGERNGEWLLSSTYDMWVEKDRPKKIIITTDSQLIKYGVQGIDDEFLEWFVKNPSCESVETHIVKLCTNCGQQYCDNINCRGYDDEPEYLISYPENTTQRIITYCDGYEVNTEKIIIPREESKQDLEKEMFELEQQLDIPSSMRWHNSKPKQETLEEVRKVERSDLYNKIHSIVKQIPREDVETDAMDASSCAYDIEQLFYKWQAERKYSEEDMNEFAWYFHTNLRQFTDDQQALDKGMYLKMWLKKKQHDTV